jgi:hypothetical protein
VRRDVKDFAVGLAVGVLAVVVVAEAVDRLLRWFSGERRVRWPWR